MEHMLSFTRHKSDFGFYFELSHTDDTLITSDPYDWMICFYKLLLQSSESL